MIKVTDEMVEAFESKWLEVSDNDEDTFFLKEAIQAAIGASKDIRQLQAQNEWQPIETAPKDGTEFLVRIKGSMTVYNDTSDPLNGYYPGPDWNVTLVDRVTIASFIQETNSFVDDFGNFYGLDFIDNEEPEGSPDGDGPLTMICWRPLPELPKEQNND